MGAPNLRTLITDIPTSTPDLPTMQKRSYNNLKLDNFYGTYCFHEQTLPNHLGIKTRLKAGTPGRVEGAESYIQGDKSNPHTTNRVTQRHY
jgi:hypothetical protein